MDLIDLGTVFGEECTAEKIANLRIFFDGLSAAIFPANSTRIAILQTKYMKKVTLPPNHYILFSKNLEIEKSIPPVMLTSPLIFSP